MRKKKPTMVKLFMIQALLILVMVVSYSQQPDPVAVTWSTMDEILKRIVPPSFPGKDFDIVAYGAVSGGEKDCSEAFRSAIEACNLGGGGRVVVPAGEFLTGPLYLKSNVNLYVSKEARIRFSTDPKKYLPVVYTRWEGIECMNYSALIYAFEEKNIAVTGEGILDGQGSNDLWWTWNGKKEYGWKEGMPSQKAARKKLVEMGEHNVPVAERIFGEGSYLRPNFFQPYKCENVLVAGATFKNSPMWFLHPVLSRNITIDGVTVEGLGPNNDGCDPESCKDVLIRKCKFNTGDDCIAIKSGRNADGRRVNVPAENIVIQKCQMKDGHGGVVLGSEISGGVRNVFAEDCEMDSPNLDRALRFKTNSVRGGFIENFFARRINVGQVAEAVFKVDFYYEEGDAGAFTPSMRNVHVSDLVCNKGEYAFWVKGYERSPISSLLFTNCRFDGIKKANVLEHILDLQCEGVTINGVPFGEKKRK
jgi:polygalacturonase